MIFSRFTTTVVALIAVVASQSAALAQNALLGSVSVDVAQGGPFTANNRRTQRFVSTFELSERDLKRQLTLVIHNGVGGTPGFNWLRVFLGADVDLSGLDRAGEPSADLLFDESYIQRHTVTLDLSDKVFNGVNTLIIEGTAQKGAVLSWVVEGQALPEFASINPTSAAAGSRLTLNGRGFSVDPGENKISIGGQNAELLSATKTTLTVKVPAHLNPGRAAVVVTTNNVESAPYSISITAPGSLTE